ncbi:MAG TPA: hypothetical protein DHV80_02595, partial [Acidimicrobiaceae bacterium]|nr:hypothetical protein [Acidimicrobiaceae bacterium]
MSGPPPIEARLLNFTRAPIPTIADALNNFIFAEDIEITVDDSLHWLSIHGPAAFDRLASTPTEEHTNTTVTINNTELAADRF